MLVNSHIQAPRSVIARFVDSNFKKVHYIDVKTGYIGLCGAKKLGTELGWYSDDVEKLLSNKLENPFAKWCNRIIRFIKGENSDLHISEEDDVLVKSYLITSIGRSDCIFKMFDDEKCFNQIDSQVKHDLMVRLSLKTAEFEDIRLSEYTWEIFHNKSSSFFILPRNCFYVVDDDIEKLIVMPISTEIAIGLFPKEFSKRNSSFSSERIVAIYDNETIRYMNSRAMQYESVMNDGFAVSARKGELEEAWNCIKDKKEKLQEIKMALLKRE